MEIISTIVIGLIVGAIAKLLMPGKQGGGFILTAVLGVAGSFLATYGGQMLGMYKAGQGAGFLASVVGALIVLFIYGMVRKKTA
jgi:uncharacterized membrane protein YeaQ/YmgE (transglycosylase-associated protein family)